MSSESIERRKADHIEVAASGRADFRSQGTLLDHVRLVHQSLPELSVREIDLSTQLFGKTLSAPILITGMTGGTPEARQINRDLALAAEEMGVAFGVGSQRAMAEHPELASTYQIRDIAPNVLLIGNLGVVQAAQYGSVRVAELAEAIGADAMAIHLNPAQEMMQAHGDRNFRGALDILMSLNETLEIPLVVKETGCGISKEAAHLLRQVGVAAVDVSGAGGTSWVAVEKHRAAPDSREEKLADEYWDWGVPTAVSVHCSAAAGLQTIASGGLRTGLDIARSIALGARVGGMAAPILRAWQRGGADSARSALAYLIESLTTAHLLTGCKTPAELASAPRHISEPLRSWLADV